MSYMTDRLKKLTQENKIIWEDTIDFFIVTDKTHPNIEEQGQYQFLMLPDKNIQDLLNSPSNKDLIDGYNRILTHIEDKDVQAKLFISLKGILYTKLKNGLNFFYENISEEKQLMLKDHNIVIENEISKIETKLDKITYPLQNIPFAKLNKEHSSVKNAKQYDDFYRVMILMIQHSEDINNSLIPEIMLLNFALQTNQINVEEEEEEEYEEYKEYEEYSESMNITDEDPQDVSNNGHSLRPSAEETISILNYIEGQTPPQDSCPHYSLPIYISTDPNQDTDTDILEIMDILDIER